MPGTQLSTSGICEALTRCAADYRPGYFRVLKNALSFDVRERGYSEAAKRILLTPNPTTLPGSTIPPKAKLHAVKALSEDDIAALLHHLGKTRHYDVFAAVTLAWLLGVRPCEMHSIQVTREGFHIIGAKNLNGLKYIAIVNNNLKNPIVSMIGFIFDFPFLWK